MTNIKENKLLVHLRHTPWIYWLLTVALIVIPIFGSMEKLPVRLWDESRLAINAWEMSKSSNWWVTTFDFKPDMWNTKPPLLIWMQALMIKIIGLRPMALRLPIALAVFVTFLALFQFTRRQVGSALFGLLVALVLVTSSGYLGIHVARTGDYDGLLILFMVGYCISFFHLLQEGKRKYFYWFFILLTLAVLTKSIAGLLLLPGLGIYALTKKKVGFLLRSPHFYVGTAIFLITIAAYYLTREHYNPGYLSAVYENEINGRYVQGIEGHKHPFMYYFNRMSNIYYSYWLVLALLGACISFAEKKSKMGDIGRYATIIAASYLLIISLGQSKLEWYIAPIYPFMAIITAISLFKLIGIILDLSKFKSKRYYGLSLLFILSLIFYLPYSQTIKEEVIEARSTDDDFLSNYINHNMKNSPESLEGNFLVSDDYIPHVQFYLLMAQEKGIHIFRKYSNQVKAGDIVITIQNLEENSTVDGLRYVKIYDYDHIKKYEVEAADTLPGN